jgi:hypothetical protein
MRASQLKFCVSSRDPRWRPAAAPWLRALSDPPVKLDEDDWPLIEHIRTTGQLGSGSVLDEDSLFNRPWPTRSNFSLPVSKDASERANAEARARADAEQALSAERVRLYRQHTAKDIAQARQRAEHARAERDRRRRERDETWRMQREMDQEHARLRRERATEQERRDAEWDRATPSVQLKPAIFQNAGAQDHAVSTAIFQRNEAAIDRHQAAQRAAWLFDPAMVAKLEHEHRKMKIQRLLNFLTTIPGQRQIRIGDVMDMIGCQDDAEMQRCITELGLSWSPRG